MSRPLKEIPWSLYVSQIHERLLKERYCSATWLKACVTKVASSEGYKACIDQSIYPPSGVEGTGMIKCSECKRWAPRDVMEPLSTNTCMDCLVEIDRNAFEQRSNSLHDSTLSVELCRLQNSYVPISVQIVRFGHYYSDLWEKECPNSGRQEIDYCVVGATFRDCYARHYLWVGKQTALAIHSSEENYFDNSPQNYYSQRSLGCQAVLLSEDEKSLKKEIEYYRKKGELCPWSIQEVHVNPYKKTTRQGNIDESANENR